MLGSQLPNKVGKGVKTVRVVETLLVLSMTAFHLSIVAGSIGANELVANSQPSGRCLKEGFQIALTVGEAISELKTVISLDTFDCNTFTGKMRNDLA